MTHLSYSSQQSQRGATIIIVLMLLLMISVIGVIALKQSSTDLKLASSDQINTLLLQSSDSSVQRVEDIVNGKQGAPTSSDFMLDNPTGALGYFILQPKKTKNDVYTYCFDPTTNYLATTATILSNGTPVASIQNGSCLNGANFKTTTDMGSAVTQVSIKPSVFKEGIDENFSRMQIGQDTDDDSSKKRRFDIDATSAIPTYGDGNVKSDYNKKYFKTAELQEYLKGKNVPYLVVYEQADVFKKLQNEECIHYGKGSFDAKCNK
ncbi:MAG: hypothetical protein KGV51_00295 [Moraxellaceae bacterium]|nr:hypothetical protein [Moraxellaceae bacterium]